MNKIWALAGSALVAVAAFACSSSSSGGSSNNSCLLNTAPGGANGSCAQCAQSKCASAISTFEGDCSSYISCVCPGGTFNESNVSMCQSKIDSTCQSGDSTFGQCITSNCESECSTSGSSSGGGSGSGSGGTTGGGACVTGTGTTQVCTQNNVTSTCGSGATAASSCPTSGLSGCCKVTSGSVTEESCYYDPSSASSTQSACTQAGGTWSTSP